MIGVQSIPSSLPLAGEPIRTKRIIDEDHQAGLLAPGSFDRSGLPADAAVTVWYGEIVARYSGATAADLSPKGRTAFPILPGTGRDTW